MPGDNHSPDVTQVLVKLTRGDTNAASELFPLVYEELRALASRLFQAQPSDHTLQPTALVHEAYLRMVRGSNDWNDRAHFFAIAARAMRQILVNHALAREAAKRGAGRHKRSLDGLAQGAAPKDGFVLALDEALHRLAGFDERCGQIVELRFFGGLTIKETAAVLDISPRSVDRAWNFAKGWLNREITKEVPT